MIIGAKLRADKINQARRVLKLFIPVLECSSLDREEGNLYDPEEDRIFVEELKKHLRRRLPIEEVDCSLEEIGTAQALVQSLDQLMKLGKKITASS